MGPQQVEFRYPSNVVLKTMIVGREDVQFKMCCEPRWGPGTYGTVISLYIPKFLFKFSVLKWVRLIPIQHKVSLAYTSQTCALV
jgi:hypothetical protein